jgi:hypothetical protein
MSLLNPPACLHHGLLITASICCLWRHQSLSGIMKDQIRWSKGGEWEPIKIPQGNLTYVPNRFQRASFLTRPRPHSYWTTIGPQNRVRELESMRKHKMVQVKQQASLQQQKQLNKLSYYLTYISTNSLLASSWNDHENTVRTRRTQSLDPVTQEQDQWLRRQERLSLATFHGRWVNMGETAGVQKPNQSRAAARAKADPCWAVAALVGLEPAPKETQGIKHIKCYES